MEIKVNKGYEQNQTKLQKSWPAHEQIKSPVNNTKWKIKQ